jgi:prolyl oligopeptidase
MQSAVRVYCAHMRTLNSCLLALVLAVSGGVSRSATTDPYLWLEDAHGSRAMNWVKAENEKTLRVLQSDSRYDSLFQDAKQLAEAKDRIPSPMFLGGRIYNFWQDAEHSHGIWRQTSLEDYQSATPQWHTVIDLDALSKSDGANWFWKGADCLEPAQQRCLVFLSDGGEDAITVREFDLSTGTFVADGFSLPSGKQSLIWEDANSLLVAREWVKGEMSQAGYPIVVKRLKRDQALKAAVEIYRGTPADFGVFLRSLDDGAGHHAVMIERGVEFFHFDRFLVHGDDAIKLAIPRNSQIEGMIDHRVIVSLQEDWPRNGAAPLEQGSLVAFDLQAASQDAEHLAPVLIYKPGAREAFVNALTTRGHLLVHALDNVNARAFAFHPEPNAKWSKQTVPLPDKASLNLIDADLHGERTFVRTTGFLTPPQMILLDLASNSAKTVKTLPVKFDATHDVVEQFEATSKDGTQIPYFIVHPAAPNPDGNTPTILEAYGGFLSSLTPQYNVDLGKLWLERGGAYVLANIRGGGEFGPKWHEAGLKTHRQRIYDDFAAVAQDLVARHFTNTPHLGIRGGSNGGLLMGVEFTQHPEMWAAVDIQVPLLDMLRFEKIAAGSSWTAEYGSVSNPEERKFLASISPYHNLKAGVQYPEALIWTTTKDDRVGPQHARKFAAKLAAMKVPYLFYEVVEGGHGAGATPAEHAQTAAIEYTYFARKLMSSPPLSP